MTDRLKRLAPTGLAGTGVALLGASVGVQAASAPSIADMVERVGVSAALLLLVLAAVFSVGRWAAAVVVEPLVRAHTEFVRKVAATTEDQARSARAQAASIARLEDRLGDHATTVERAIAALCQHRNDGSGS